MLVGGVIDSNTGLLFLVVHTLPVVNELVTENVCARIFSRNFSVVFSSGLNKIVYSFGRYISMNMMILTTSEI